MWLHRFSMCLAVVVFFSSNCMSRLSPFTNSYVVLCEFLLCSVHTGSVVTKQSYCNTPISCICFSTFVCSVKWQMENVTCCLKPLFVAVPVLTPWGQIDLLRWQKSHWQWCVYEGGWSGMSHCTTLSHKRCTLLCVLPSPHVNCLVICCHHVVRSSIAT